VLIEPHWLTSPECDPRHVGFLLDGVTEARSTRTACKPGAKAAPATPVPMTTAHP
jgi:hypothetical protein